MYAVKDANEVRHVKRAIRARAWRPANCNHVMYSRIIAKLSVAVNRNRARRSANWFRLNATARHGALLRSIEIGDRAGA